MRTRAAPEATVSRQPVLPQEQGVSWAASTRTWVISPAAPVPPLYRRPSAMTPAPMPGADLDHDRLAALGGLDGVFAHGHAVGVVLDGGRYLEAVGEPVADGELVPAGHPGRERDDPGGDVDRAGEGQAHAPESFASVPVGECGECLGEAWQRGLGAVRRGEGHGRDVREAAAGEDDPYVRVLAAQLGRDREAVAAAQPEHLARSAAGGGAGAVLGDQAQGHQLAHREGDRRGCGAEQFREFGAGGGLPGGEEFEDVLGQ
jgi:hypothetical protein